MIAHDDDETKEIVQSNTEESAGVPNVRWPVIDGIQIIELLGQGGMSLVYKARQATMDRIVAVKVLTKLGEDGIKRFQKEAKLTSVLDHPNIVKVNSFGISKDGQPYLVIEYLQGLSLADYLKQNRQLTLQKFKDVFIPALLALGQAHESGLVHRDIKPGNIMICKTDTAPETVKVVDFGIAKVFAGQESETQNLTKSGAVLGSPTYMSPEQCQGKPLDGRSDLYSLACVMYESLLGETPFSGNSLLEVMQNHIMEPPPAVAELRRRIKLNKELSAAILWGLAKDPAARPQTASEFANRLNKAFDEIFSLDSVPRLTSPSKKPSPKHKIAMVVILILLLGGLVFAYSNFLAQQSGFTSFFNKQFDTIAKNDSDRIDKIFNIITEMVKRAKAKSTYRGAVLIRLSQFEKEVDALPRTMKRFELQTNIVKYYRELGRPPAQADKLSIATVADLEDFITAEQQRNPQNYAQLEQAFKLVVELCGDNTDQLDRKVAKLCSLAENYSRQRRFADMEVTSRQALMLVLEKGKKIPKKNTLARDSNLLSEIHVLEPLAAAFQNQYKLQDAQETILREWKICQILAKDRFPGCGPDSLLYKRVQTRLEEFCSSQRQKDKAASVKNTVAPSTN